MIRAYLNDGTTDYGQHLTVDSLAFGHAPYAYRNLGRPSTIRVQQDWHNFRVEVDGKLCFETSTVRIPPGYHFGITAASAETPDSFEVFKLVVTTDTADQGHAYNMGSDDDAAHKEQEHHDADQHKIQERDQYQHGSGHSKTDYLAADRIPEDRDIPYLPASEIDATKQFADLHYRLQYLMKSLDDYQADFHLLQTETSIRHGKLLELFLKLEHHTGNRQFPYEQLNAMDRRLEVMERAVGEVKREVSSSGEMGKQMEGLRRQFMEGHSNILEGVHGHVGSVARSVPKWGAVVLLVLGSQAGIVFAFLAYKRRKAVGMKKYL